jgi:hypothetical protein
MGGSGENASTEMTVASLPIGLASCTATQRPASPPPTPSASPPLLPTTPVTAPVGAGPKCRSCHGVGGNGANRTGRAHSTAVRKYLVKYTNCCMVCVCVCVCMCMCMCVCVCVCVYVCVCVWRAGGRGGPGVGANKMFIQQTANAYHVQRQPKSQHNRDEEGSCGPKS